jgi:aspartate 1-decarboxylase
MTNLMHLLSGKIHGARITSADLAYEGSLTIPLPLLEASGISEYEAVHVWNVTSGTRLQTYAIKGRPGSNEICANGAAAHLIKPNDKVIIAAFTWVDREQVKGWLPKVVFVDEENQIKEVRKYETADTVAPTFPI